MTEQKEQLKDGDFVVDRREETTEDGVKRTFLRITQFNKECCVDGDSGLHDILVEDDGSTKRLFTDSRWDEHSKEEVLTAAKEAGVEYREIGDVLFIDAGALIVAKREEVKSAINEATSFQSFVNIGMAAYDGKLQDINASVVESKMTGTYRQMFEGQTVN